MGGILIAIVVAASMLGGIVFGILFILPSIYDFRLTASGVEVVVFKNISIYKVPFAKMINVSIVNALSVTGLSVNPFRAIRIGNRFVSRGVLIEKRGALTFLLITPKDPEMFIKKIETHIRSA